MATASITLGPFGVSAQAITGAVATANVTLGPVGASGTAIMVVGVVDYSIPRFGTVISTDVDPNAVDPRQGTIIT